MTFERAEKGIERGDPFTITIDGKEVVAYSGETIAGAMLAAGKMTLGHSGQKKSPRGVYCGIGVCYSCLVTIDHLPSQRACQTPAKGGMAIESEKKTEQSHENI